MNRALVGILAVSATAIEVDAHELGDEARMLVEDNFKDDWSVGDAGPGGTGSSTPGAPRQRGESSEEWFARCIEQIYRGSPHPLYAQGVAKAQRYLGIDAESAAADAALSVCSRGKEPDELKSYYLRAVENTARTARRKAQRFGQCAPRSHENIGIPRGGSPEDCLLEKLCQLHGVRPQDYEVLMLELTGHTDPEIATLLHILPDTAKKRRQRAEARLREFARECVN